MRLLSLFLCLPLAAMANAIRSADTAPSGKSDTAALPTAAERWGDVAKAEAPSFRRHVVPLFSRAGCSGRECHGAFSGQAGFQLSLFGYDFEKDHKEITNDPDDGPRIDLKDPAASLILTKASLDRGEKHKGKKRFEKGSWEYNLVLRWIQEGAKLDVAETGEFDRLEVMPKEIIFKKPGDTAQLRVMAHWKDGTIEDVTQLTRFRTNDESVADVSATGLVSCKEKGDTHIVAFYDNGVQPVPTMLPASEFTGTNFPKVPARTKVDALVNAKLSKAGIVPSEVCTDAEFLRRVSLDMTATLPSPEEVSAFIADKSPNKRQKKIEDLLHSTGYAAWWTTLLCDFSGNNPRQLNTGGELQLAPQFSRQWYDWIYKRVSENTAYDQIVAGMVLANTRSKPEQTYEEFAKEMVSYFRDQDRADFSCRATMPYFWQRQNVQKPEEKALAFAHTFLGVRIECAQCHKHPFDQWTQTDFKQFQAFFEPLAYGNRNDDKDLNANKVQKDIEARLAVDYKTRDGRTAVRKEMARMLKAGEILPWREVWISQQRLQQQQRALSPEEIERRKKKDPTFTGRVFTPKILGGGEVMLTTYPDPREPLMEWLRGKENPYFARAFVNRVWAAYFGRGIVEPADDMNLANPPSNKELIDYLATGFAGHNYDMKWLHREIANSDAYQRSWKTTPSNKLDDKNFSHARIRRLPAEVVFDSLALATADQAGQQKFRNDLETRAIGPNSTISGKSRGGDSYTLTTFGKPQRIMNCDCERTSDPTLLQTIYTRNDPALISMLDSSRRDGFGWIEEIRQSIDPKAAQERMTAELERMKAKKESVAKTYAEKVQKDQLGENGQEQYESMNKEIDERIARAQETLSKEQQRKPFNLEGSIQQAFLRTVSRPPTDAELSKAKEDVTAAANPADGVRELLWALLNTREFIVNH